jgi:aspartate aminotransferase-like enzyme
MGYSAQQANVMLVLSAFEHALRREGFEPDGSGTAAAEAIYRG